MFRPKDSTSVGALIGLSAFHEPMNTDQVGICGIETHDVRQGSVLGFSFGGGKARIGTATVQKRAKRLIGALLIHSSQDFLDAREEIALGELAVGITPVLSVRFDDFPA